MKGTQCERPSISIEGMVLLIGEVKDSLTRRMLWESLSNLLRKGRHYRGKEEYLKHKRMVLEAIFDRIDKEKGAK